jgi:adenosine deaminase/aminodeoxyfutalosine deaminase
LVLPLAEEIAGGKLRYTQAVSEILEFLHRLPKAELHLHFEGTILPSTLVELSQRHAPIAPEAAEALYHYTDFTGFLQAFKAVCNQLVTPEDYELAAWRMAQHLADQGIVHAEVFLSVGVIYRWQAEGEAAFPAIFAGLERARARAAQELGLSLYWIFDAVRHFTVEEGERVFRAAASMREQYPSIIGIGLGGDERLTGSEPYRAIYAEARAAGLRLTNHAGETTGPEAIREALSIGSERLGHALSAIQDPALVQELKTRSVPLEMNPTSNVRTGLCPSFAGHPLRRCFEAGLLVTLNSDDPAFFGSDLLGEYMKAHTEQNFSPVELAQLAQNSFAASFLPETEKQSWNQRVAAHVEALSSRCTD